MLHKSFNRRSEKAVRSKTNVLSRLEFQRKDTRGSSDTSRVSVQFTRASNSRGLDTPGGTKNNRTLGARLSHLPWTRSINYAPCLLGAAAAEAFPVVGASRDLNTHSKMDLPLTVGKDEGKEGEKKKKKKLVALFRTWSSRGSAPGLLLLLLLLPRTHSILTLIITGKNDGLKCGHSSAPIDIANAA